MLLAYSKMNIQLNEKNLEKVLNDRTLRVTLATESFEWFIAIYLNHHFNYAFAPFHKDLMDIVQNPDITKAFIAAFRSSGKTTLITHAGALWSIFGKPKKKYVVMLGLTKSQVEEHFNNIRKELEINSLLINDFGKSKTPFSKWAADTLEIPALGAKIIARSRGESIRGAKELSERPDLILCDDLDDVGSAKTLERRNDLINWFNSEVMTLGFDDFKVIVTGNIVHPDCFLVRMEELIKKNDPTSRYMKIPFFDSDGKPNWLSRFPTDASVQKLRDSIFDPRVWKREYELIPVTLLDQIIKEEDLHYYEQIPNTVSNGYRYSLISVDPAVSEKQSADYSAIVFAEVFERDSEINVYIQPHFINERVDTELLLSKIEHFYEGSIGKNPIILIENSGFQELIAKQLERKTLKVERVNPRGVGKIDRFMTVSNLVKSGAVKFHNSFSGIFKEQILYSGMTKHDDLLDAFVYILQYVVENKKKVNDVVVVKYVDLVRRRYHKQIYGDSNKISYQLPY